MRLLHVSKEDFQSWDTRIDPRQPTAACGSEGYVVKHGYGEGLVPYTALHPHYHCPACIAILTQRVSP